MTEQPPAQGCVIPAGYALVPIVATREMIEAACEGHYGKRRSRKHGGAAGVAMTVNGTDFTFVKAFASMWKGALAAAPPPPEPVAGDGWKPDPGDLDALRYVLNFADEATQVRTVMRTFTLPERVTTKDRLERLYAELKALPPAPVPAGEDGA